MASPPKKVDKDICTRLISVCKSDAILGKAGRYISIAKGPKAVRLIRVNIRIHS